jgi:predicted RNA-binding Zn-ribbon protein involved in translation (DUF1610 family)
MRCTTCGEFLREHEAACPRCGAVVSQRPLMGPTGVEVRSCPRCGHLGTGVKYFQRPGHMVLLLGISVFTYGFGGLAYYFARRKRRICGECGLGWERTRALGPGFAGHPVSAASAGTGSGGPGTAFNAAESLPRRGVGRRVLGVAMVLLATLIVAIGFIEFELGAIAAGSVFGAAGTATVWWGLKAREDRRHAIMARLQRQVLLLATEKSGTLTVTEVAASLNMSLSAAEEVLGRMDDGLRVRSDITDEGVIVYEFPELRHNLRLESGSAG